MIDAHHHLWEVARGDYGWLDSQKDAALAPIVRDFTADDYSQVMTTHLVTGSVLVQAAPTEAETAWLIVQAKRAAGRVKGVVGWIDLSASDSVEKIQLLAQEPLLKGIRPMLQDIENVNWLAQDQVQKGLEAMTNSGLALDLLVRTEHLPTVLRVLQEHPKLKAVIDHAAKPELRREDWFGPWARFIRAIADKTHAYCKFSGLVTESLEHMAVSRIESVFDHLATTFGPQRLMWGSDWPVCELAGGYTRWLHMAQTCANDLSDDQKHAIFHTNAEQFYVLNAK